MIVLKVKEMCSNCSEFYPTSDTIWENDIPTHYVTCYNVDICKRIRKYLTGLQGDQPKEGFDNVED